MRIQSTLGSKQTTQKVVSSQVPKPETAGVEEKKTPWRRITLNEAVVEIPQSVLELSSLSIDSPGLATGLQLGISSLAAARAVQCFHDAESLEEVLEGVSSTALALAGGVSLLPGAGAWNQGLLVGHGTAELALGIREVTEELKKENPARLELAAGVLDSVKGASTFVPLIFPETSNAVNVFQIGAILTKTAMEPFMERSYKS